MNNKIYINGNFKSVYPNKWFYYKIKNSFMKIYLKPINILEVDLFTK